MATATVNGNDAKKSGGFFSNLANPVIRKMEKNAVYDAEGKVATYGGVASKTIFFLIVTFIGFLGFIVLHNIMLNNGAKLFHAVSEDGNAIYDLTISGVEIGVIAVAALISIITPFLAWLIRPTIPVTGTIYALAQGVVIGFITIALREDLRWIALLAAILTVALVAVMLFVYAKRIIKVTARFRGIIFALFGTIVIGGIIYFILYIIPATRQMLSGVNQVLNSPVVSIIFSIVFIIIAALFMLVDFDTIERCVEGKMEKKYEWMAAWGLAYTILYVYFKILRLLIMIFGRSRGSSSKSSSF